MYVKPSILYGGFKMKFKIFIISIILLMLFGCSLINGPNKHSSFENFTYPLEVGNSWTYERTISYSNILPDTVNIWFPLVDKGSIVVEVSGTDSFYVAVDDTLVIQKELSILNQVSIDSTNHQIADSNKYYLCNYNDGMYMYGSVQGNLAIPVSGSFIEDVIRERNINKKKEKETQVTSPAPVEFQSLKYPIEINSEWLFVDESDYYFTLYKKIIGFKKLTTIIGTYDCFVIEWIEPFDSYTMIDYISEIGLMKRTITNKGIQTTDPNNANQITFDLIDEIILVEFSQEK